MYTASQMWLLGRLLPQMVGHLVPTNDECWLNVLDLLEIVDRLLAPELTEDETVTLSSMIADHHHEFKHLYPRASITPKFHCMVHMPRLSKYTAQKLI